MNRLLKLSNTIINKSYYHRNIFCQGIKNLRNHPISKPLDVFRIKTSPVRASHYQQVMPNERIVGKWLIACGGMVYLAVVLGGVTRLTESGLSMVSWRLLGEKVPRTDLDWNNEFAKYKEYPEFKLKNQNMTLDEFKTIFWMEYIHRMWGRVIGAAFLLPAAYFWKNKYFNRQAKQMVLLLGALIGSQGLMGWYMVKSGLENRFDDVNDVPRVSQHRLAIHLAAAFILYTLFLSQGLKRLLPSESLSNISSKVIRFKKLAYIAKGLIFITAFSGAFVAGLDAGLVYNSFPKMGDKWIPDDILALKPINKNLTENPTTVQFNHRILGISTLTLISVMWLLSRKIRLPRRAYWAINAAAIIGCFQVSLGITTLLHHVPVSLAAAHQSGSLLLLSVAVWLSHELKFLKYIPK